MTKLLKSRRAAGNNQSFVACGARTMKLLLNPSASSGQARFGSSFQELWGCRKIFK